MLVVVAVHTSTIKTKTGRTEMKVMRLNTTPERMMEFRDRGWNIGSQWQGGRTCRLGVIGGVMPANIQDLQGAQDGEMKEGPGLQEEETRSNSSVDLGHHIGKGTKEQPINEITMVNI